MNWIEAIEALLEPDHTTTDLHRGHSTVHFVWEGSFDEDPEGTEEGIYDHETPRSSSTALASKATRGRVSDAGSSPRTAMPLILALA
jgi:hypothetical protein